MTLPLADAHYVNITSYGITTVRGPVVTELTLTMKMLAIVDRAATNLKPTSAEIAYEFSTSTLCVVKPLCYNDLRCCLVIHCVSPAD